MDVLDAVRGRRNMKQFKPDPISEEKILEWFETAKLAPNHRMTEPWEIRFVGPKTRQNLGHKPNFGDAPIVIAILSKAGNSPIERDENLISTACFVQNFLLLAHREGVGARWTSIGGTPAGREVLGVSDDFIVVGVFGVGYPEEIPAQKARSPIGEKTVHLP